MRLMILCGCKTFLVTLCWLLVSSSAYSGMIDKEGMNEWEICAMCHNLNGISRMAKFPKLAGQKPAYISKQFMDFHQGRRTNDGGQMEAITTEVDLEQLDNIAGYFAQLPPPPAAQLEGDHESMLRFSQGEKLFNQGLDNIPACANCHNSAADPQSLKVLSVDSKASAVAPWLFAQHESYLVKQLLDFKSGNRDNDADDSMHLVAKNLDDESIRAVAFYLARKER